MLRRINEDIKAALRQDPAARNSLEVILTYPGLHAVWGYRIAHLLWNLKLKLLARIYSNWMRAVTGIEIHPAAKIGRRFFIDHGMGTVIGETAEIGDRVMLYQGVTLGGTGKQSGKRHPTLEDDVIVGVGASILGAITIAQGARIGGGAVVVKDVPAHSTAIGIPARVVATRDPVTGITRRVEELPDPEGDMLRQLRDRLLELETRIDHLEAHTIDDHQHVPHNFDDSPFNTAIWRQLDHSTADSHIHSLTEQQRRDKSYDDSAL